MIKNVISILISIFTLIMFFITLYLAYCTIKHFMYSNYTEFFERLTSFILSYIATLVSAYIGNKNKIQTK